MVMNAITSRKSIRKYSDKPITEETLNKILDAGRLAPSWCNVQPWKFIVVKSQEIKNLLCEASGGQAQVKNAKVLICAVADLDSWSHTKFGKILAEKGLDETSTQAYLNSKVLNPSNVGEYEVLLRSVEGVTYAVSYMTLEAQELGVGVCVVGAFANEVTKTDETLTHKVKAALGLNEKQVLIDILTLGYEDNPRETKKLRKSFDEVVSFV